MERFVDAKFKKYVNNDGNSCQKVLGKSSIFKQAETWVHFFYKASNEKFLLNDLQGPDYKLYDPEIATIETLIEAPSAEEFFCTGNLRETAINTCFCSTQKQCVLS